MVLVQLITNNGISYVTQDNNTKTDKEKCPPEQTNCATPQAIGFQIDCQFPGIHLQQSGLHTSKIV